MAQLHKSAATLRICGDDLNPDEITDLLGTSPTHAQRKGDKFVAPKKGRVRVAKPGMWRLEAADCEPENLDGQIRELLEKTNRDLKVWRTLSSRYEIDLFCGLFMAEGIEGLTLSSDSLTALGERGIEIGFDIYSPPDGKCDEAE
jgi:hypothetical protein